MRALVTFTGENAKRVLRILNILFGKRLKYQTTAERSFVKIFKQPQITPSELQLFRDEIEAAYEGREVSVWQIRPNAAKVRIRFQGKLTAKELLIFDEKLNGK